jgi:hypothetical protein
MQPITRTLAIASIVVQAACADRVTAPAAPAVQLDRQRAADAGHPLAAVHWNEVARALVKKYRTDPAARTYAAVSLAQLAAASEVKEHGGKRSAATRGAVAGASAAVLEFFYPNEAAFLGGELRAQLDAEDTGDIGAAEEGAAKGRAVAEPVIEQTRTDGSDAAWDHVIPTGPGYWRSSATAEPVTPMLGHVRPFFLESGSQLRPVAPPSFGSPEFVAALAEVRWFSDNRTPDQAKLASDWSYSGGTIRMPGYWNEVAAELILAGPRGLQRERKAAIVFSLLNAAMMDATIACFDAKYIYWYIRPSQADPLIKLATSLSNHPSYPSSHSCTSGAGAEILATLFPADAARLYATAAEIGFSRLVGGLHYRFDIDVGHRMGVQAARIALASGRRQLVAATEGSR